MLHPMYDLTSSIFQYFQSMQPRPEYIIKYRIVSQNLLSNINNSSQSKTYNSVSKLMSNIKSKKGGQKQPFDALAKIAVIGDSSVGKTNILLRYVSDEYQMSHIVTIGIDFKVKKIDLDGYKLKMQIWDTAGQQRFRNLSGTIYQGAQAIVLVYAINSRKSFNNVQVWMKDIYEKMKGEYILAIVGNKSDLEDERQVSTDQGVAISKKYKASIFTQTSAKQGTNIQTLFQKVGIKIKHKLQMQKKTQNFKQQKGKAEETLTKTRSMTTPGKQPSNRANNKNVKLTTSEVKKPKKKSCC